MHETDPPSPERHPARRSLLGLDGLNLFMADVAGGLGPYLSVYLAGTRHWHPGDIGLAMAASGVAAAVFQIPAGLLVDAARAKRALIVGSALLVALGCLLTAALPGLLFVLAAQAVVGLASAVIGPAVAAVTLGLVGRSRFDRQTSRNQAVNHLGNFLAAGLAGGLGQALGTIWIFYLVCLSAGASAACTLAIKPSDIDHDLARGGERIAGDGAARAMPLRDLARCRPLLVFLGCVVLFHFGNAAMLPMAGQVLALHHPGSDAMALSACIIAAQLTMVGVSWGVGRAMEAGYGRRTIFLVAFAVLPVRGVLFTFAQAPVPVVVIQLLDGVAAGIFGVISVVIAADIMAGTGRFNLAQGLVALAVGLGASLSNVVSGFVVQSFGYPAGFLFLAVAAVLALVAFAVLMPETAPARTGRTRRGPSTPLAARA